MNKLYSTLKSVTFGIDSEISAEDRVGVHYDILQQLPSIVTYIGDRGQTQSKQTH